MRKLKAGNFKIYKNRGNKRPILHATKQNTLTPVPQQYLFKDAWMLGPGDEQLEFIADLAHDGVGCQHAMRRR